MTTATIEVEDESVEGCPRRIVVITVAVLLPADFECVDIADIIPTEVTVDVSGKTTLTDFIQTTVQEAHLVMT